MAGFVWSQGWDGTLHKLLPSSEFLATSNPYSHPDTGPSYVRTTLSFGFCKQETGDGWGHVWTLAVELSEYNSLGFICRVVIPRRRGRWPDFALNYSLSPFSGFAKSFAPKPSSWDDQIQGPSGRPLAILPRSSVKERGRMVVQQWP